MSFKKGFLAVALLLVALMTFGGCGGGGGGDSPGPDPSIIDGTWKVSTISYGGSPLAVSSNPSTFPVRMIYNESAGTYTAYVNNGADVACEDSAGTGFTVSTVDNLTRIGSSERYESDSGTLELIGGELVVTSGSVTITFARATGPGPEPGPSKINGTWRVTELIDYYRDAEGNNQVTRYDPTARIPETFPAKVIPNSDGTYKIDVNNGGDVTVEYGGSTRVTLESLQVVFTKAGDERYEFMSEGSLRLSVELTDTNTVEYTTYYPDNEYTYMFKIILTRQ